MSPTSKRQTRVFGLIRVGGGRWSALSPRRRYPSRVPKFLLCARGASAESIFRACDENAGAACLAPDALVARSGRTVVVVARNELAPVDPQLTVEEMQLF